VGKSGQKKDMCNGVYHKEKARISCEKKANYVCRMTKGEVEISKSPEAENMSSFFELSVKNKINIKTNSLTQ
jgi:hypothetical protein